MTVWEWQCVVKGWNKIHGGKKEQTYPTAQEFEDAVARARFH
jgi:hypothetical protein